MSDQLKTKYNHLEVEKRVYQYWKDIDAFSSDLSFDESKNQG